jgi:hypothetical protein
MLDDRLQLSSENLNHMERGYMDLYFQQLDWIALEIERIIPTCNMNFPKVVIKYAYKLILYRRKVYSSPFFPS